MRNRDDGVRGSGEAIAAMDTAAAYATFYEDRARAGAGGVEIVTPGAENTPQPVTGDPEITGVHP